MVGTVLVSHSPALAAAVADYVRAMAPDAPVAVAGGTEDGGFGTSYVLIEDAIASVVEPDGAVVLCDMGSAVMTAKMVLEDLDDDRVHLADCPFVEGAVECTVKARSGAPAEEIAHGLVDVYRERKL